jgi:predicted metalloprotease with PDZ domain
MWLKRTGNPEVTYLGVECVLTRRIGVFMNSTVDGYVVLRVSPDTPAARMGLRPGDRPVNPAGERPLDLADFMARVESGEEITVARQQGRIWVDTVLPEAELD